MKTALDCTDAQADMSLHWANIPRCTFCCGQVFSMFGIFITYPLYTNGLFFLVCYNKFVIVHSILSRVSGYNFQKILYSFV